MRHIPVEIATKAELGSLSENAYIRQKQLVGGIVPFSASTLWRMVTSGEFPSPIKLSPGITAWRVDDVRRWLANLCGFKVSTKHLNRTLNANGFGGAK